VAANKGHCILGQAKGGETLLSLPLNGGGGACRNGREFRLILPLSQNSGE